jgi:ribulose 1,5-bisphosphate carboxylase large subunit-like protein
MQLNCTTTQPDLSMSIKVTYKIGVKEGFKLDDVVGAIVKDISWGSFSEEFHSAKKSIEAANAGGSNGDTNWRSFQPNTTFTESNGIFQLALKDHQFNLQSEGLDHFIGTIAGDIARQRGISSFEILDVDFSQTNEGNRGYFKGPKTSIKEMRDFFNLTLASINRPLIAFSIKPRIGLNKDAYATIAKEAALGELDIIEDDERLVDPSYLSFKDRVKILGGLQATSKGKFSVNMTGNQFPMDGNIGLEEKFDLAYEAGIRIFKLDVLVSGFNTLAYLRRLANTKKEKILITSFPDIMGSYRSLSRNVVLKFARLCGADIMYARSANLDSRMDGTQEKDIKSIFREVMTAQDILLSQEDEWKNYGQTLPTMTHDFHPMVMEVMIYFMRCLYQNHNDYAFFVGGGISSVPNKSILDVSRHIKNVIEHAAKQDLKKIDFDIKRCNELKLFNYKEFEEYYAKLGLTGYKF